ncbi:N-alpha-acetyltransferase 80 isoform X2 [Lycorma delicatula]|uniref:N-alpha-acetyltransferase 80 isoform X2 n=1 Tax=Lycorma delicatula TaxID=130591 RepID=UPI003F511CC9
MEHLQVFPLHKHNEYINECVRLLNSEWPRSETARLRSFQASCDTLPTSLIMIYTPDQVSVEVNDLNMKETSDKCDQSMEENISTLPCTPVVVGHSKISRLCSLLDACFIESVIIHKLYRGKGWGKYLMEQTELFVKQLGISSIYLTTVDKQGFYSHLGYTETEPIPVFGGTPYNICSSFKQLSVSSPSSSAPSTKSSKIDTNNDKVTKKKEISNTNSSVPPPPPLPLTEQTNDVTKKKNAIGSNKTFMYKTI